MIGSAVEAEPVLGFKLPRRIDTFVVLDAHETATAELAEVRAQLAAVDAQIRDYTATIERLEVKARDRGAAHEQVVTALAAERDQARAETTAVRDELAAAQARAETAEAGQRQAVAGAEAARELTEDLHARHERAEGQTTDAREAAATARAERDTARDRSRSPAPARHQKGVGGLWRE